MTLIEGIGDEVTAIFGIFIVIIVLAISWLSTGVTDRPFVGVVILDRRRFENLINRIRQSGITLRGPNGQSVQPSTSITTENSETNSVSEEGATNNVTLEQQIASGLTLQCGGIQHNTPNGPGELEILAAQLLPSPGTSESSTSVDNAQREPEISESSQAAEGNTELSNQNEEGAISERPSVVNVENVNITLDEETLHATPSSEQELRQRRVAFYQKNEDPSSVSSDNSSGDFKTNLEQNLDHRTAKNNDTLQNDMGDRTTNTVPTFSQNIDTDRLSSDTADFGPAPSANDSMAQDTRNTTEPNNIIGDARGENVDPHQEGHIRIRLVYLDERQKLVHAHPRDTIGQFKRQHFASELGENMMVRCVYNGQELKQENSTLQSYNIVDNSVVHCLLSRVAQRANNAETTVRQDYDIGDLMVPLFGVVLALIWFCRFTYRAYFNAVSTFALLGISFLFLAAVMANWRAPREGHQHAH